MTATYYHHGHFVSSERVGTSLPRKGGLVRELNPGPLAPEARIIPLDQRASQYLQCPFVFPHHSSEYQQPLSSSMLLARNTVFEGARHAHKVTPSEITEYGARPGFEPGTSRTLSENHTPRPTSHEN